MMTVLVIGTGRCGSSTVAKLLHIRLGVSMGSQFRDPDELNPSGYYEDLEFKNLNEGLLNGTITYEHFTVKVSNLIKRRSAIPKWGIKDPRLCHMLWYYLMKTNPTCVYDCYRDEKSTITSIVKSYGWSEVVASRCVKHRRALIEDTLNKYNGRVRRIDFTNQVDEEYLIEEISKGVNGECQN